MGLLEIRSPREIIEEAIRSLGNPKEYTFSEYINAIEKQAHKIYLEEEVKAIEKLILKKFGNHAVLKFIAKDLAKWIAQISTSIANTRRARGGKSSEYILGYALKVHANIQNEVLGISKKISYYPDIAIPSKGILEKNPHKAVALAVKRTLRER